VHSGVFIYAQVFNPGRGTHTTEALMNLSSLGKCELCKNGSHAKPETKDSHMIWKKLAIWQSCDMFTSMTIKLDLSKVDRERALSAWLAHPRIQKSALATQLGVRREVISRLISGERATPGLIERLVEYGMPVELLPEPGRLPGRPKKHEQQF